MFWFVEALPLREFFRSFKGVFLQRLCYLRKGIFRICFYLDIVVTKSGVGNTILIGSAAVT